MKEAYRSITASKRSFAYDEGAHGMFRIHGIRACIIGPYQAQKLLASRILQDLLRACAEHEIDTRPDDAGQTVPSLALWIGRHELLYTRIFSS